MVGTPEHPLDGHALALTANPNEATLRYQWRGGLRGMVGLRIPIVENAASPWVFALSPALEVHNAPGSRAPVPFEHWRGRVSLELGYRLDLEERPERLSLRLSVLLSHESAHSTQITQFFVLNGGLASTQAGAQLGLRPAEQLHTNDVALRLFATKTSDTHLFALVLTQRAHFASCTLLVRFCDDVRFNFGLESELDVMFEGFALERDQWLRPYAALSALFIPAIQDMGLEGRVVVEAGATLDPGRLGRFRIFVSFLAGHEPGFLREDFVVHLGGGVGFAFF